MHSFHFTILGKSHVFLFFIPLPTLFKNSFLFNLKFLLKSGESKSLISNKEIELVFKRKKKLIRKSFSSSLKSVEIVPPVPSQHYLKDTWPKKTLSDYRQWSSHLCNDCFFLSCNNTLPSVGHFINDKNNSCQLPNQSYNFFHFYCTFKSSFK